MQPQEVTLPPSVTYLTPNFLNHLPLHLLIRQYCRIHPARTTLSRNTLKAPHHTQVFLFLKLVIARNVNRLVKLGRFETLGSLKEKAAEIENTDVRCISFMKVLDAIVGDDDAPKQSDPESPVSSPTTERLTTGTTLAILTDISPLVIEVTLRSNNMSTAIEMNRFEKMESLLAPAAALLGKSNNDVTLWCDEIRVNPSLALDSLSAHFSLLPEQIRADQGENSREYQRVSAFWLPDAPAGLTLDVMGRDFGMGVVVVCGEGKKEFLE
ncbi:hypothetical protein BLNAU_25037 [Blattamonas nauphoetae]|uniref:Uncharacterized protein n=1 Tax=Blattamonas nauphoetae TaxID=2049346 RepID=A0ABQ9WKQ8_9EUKA|nr:hypothetical protein BLNAU_25037 [Blattamonas nauphoetae]